jgi:hypothetical protein
MKKGGKMQPDLINGAIHQGLLNASSWAGSGSVKGACGMKWCVGEGIYLPLTGSEQTISWRLRPLMGHKRIVNNFLKFC